MKFKVGDKVVWSDEECEVTQVIGNGFYKVDYYGELLTARDIQMSLVEPPINDEIINSGNGELKDILDNTVKNEIISLDYRVEYHNKVEECELLQAKYDYLWHTILKEK